MCIRDRGHAECGKRVIAGLAVDAAAYGGSRQHGKKALGALGVGQRGLQCPRTHRRNGLVGVVVLGLATIGVGLHVLPTEHHQGADGMVDIGIGTGKLATKSCLLYTSRCV